MLRATYAALDVLYVFWFAIGTGLSLFFLQGKMIVYVQGYHIDKG